MIIMKSRLEILFIIKAAFLMTIKTDTKREDFNLNYTLFLKLVENI